MKAAKFLCVLCILFAFSTPAFTQAVAWHYGYVPSNYGEEITFPDWLRDDLWYAIRVGGESNWGGTIMYPEKVTVVRPYPGEVLVHFSFGTFAYRDDLVHDNDLLFPQRAVRMEVEFYIYPIDEGPVIPIYYCHYEALVTPGNRLELMIPIKL